MKSKFICLFFIVLIYSCKNNTAQQAWNYPKSKTVDSSDTYFGVNYKDPYRWLENLKDTNVILWLKNQSDFSNDILNKISGRDELIAEWKMLDSLQPPFISKRSIKNGRVFYTKTMPGESVAKVYFKEGMQGNEILLFDPTTYIKNKTLSVQACVPSYDGKNICIVYSEEGGGDGTLKIMNVDTKQFLRETIYPVLTDVTPSWTFDNTAILYDWFLSYNNDSLSSKTKLHTLGSDVKKDVDFFSSQSYPELNIKANEVPVVSVSSSAPNYLFASLENIRPELFMYYAPYIELSSNKKQWKLFCKPSELIKDIEFIDDKAYAITGKNAANNKLICADLKNPDWEHAKVIAAEKTQSLLSITHCKDYLFLIYSDGINYQLYKYNLRTEQLSEVKLPNKGIMGVYCFDKNKNDCFLVMASFNMPITEFCYNPVNNSFSASTFNKTPDYPKAYNELEIEQLEVKGHDGLMIPLTLIYKKGLKKDGSSVCLLNGYGAYGLNIDASWDEINYEKALAVKNVVIAIAHVRGGSEKGEAWHKAGFKTTKPNSWKDFNSCAEYLIKQGFTSSTKLACMGSSAGGLLVSRAITEHPDLYAAAICNVPCANKMRDEFTPSGATNIPEFGTVKDSLECKALFEMDGVGHVLEGTKYPAVICVGGKNDPNVIVWQPAKFAAALQNASISNKPILLKINYDSGHGTEDKNVTFADYANQFAFAMWQCGHPNFQLKK